MIELLSCVNFLQNPVARRLFLRYAIKKHERITPMLYKKIRNLIAVLAVMIALLPAFLYSTQHIYYGPSFSFLTTTIALLCFITSALIQLFHNKKEGLPLSGPLIFAGGFTFLLIYIIFQLLK